MHAQVTNGAWQIKYLNKWSATFTGVRQTPTSETIQMITIAT